MFASKIISVYLYVFRVVAFPILLCYLLFVLVAAQLLVAA